MSRELGLTKDWPVVIVGIGNLGAALANYGGFFARGFRTVALLDGDPAKHGHVVAGLPVEPLDDLDRIVVERRVAIAVRYSHRAIFAFAPPHWWHCRNELARPRDSESCE